MTMKSTKRYTDWHTDNIAQGSADIVAVFWWSRNLIPIDCGDHRHMGSHCIGVYRL